MNRNNSRLHRIKLCPRIIQDILKFANEKELERLKRINSNVVTRMIEAEQRRRDPENPSTSKQQNSEKASEREDDSEQHDSQKPNKNLGLNAGEPIEEDGDLFGETVILAARIAAMAQGGEILASMAVRELCAGKGFLFADLGDQAMRGFEDPVRVFEVRNSA